MKPAERRRFEQLERSLDSCSAHTLEPLSDAELTEALRTGRATPVHIKQVYDICATDLEIRIFQEATRRRNFPEFRRGWTIQRFGTAAEVLSYRADEKLDFELEWLAYQPELWPEPEGRRSSPAGREGHHLFSWWARSLLSWHVLHHDHLALELRQRLDEWYDGGNPPVDFSRYPEPRQYLLLEPLAPKGTGISDIELLRLPHQELYVSMENYARNEWPDDGLEWTTVDSLGRLVIQSEYD
jgi:hypothetical protein